MINTSTVTCPACHAAPGGLHSLACSDPDEFERRETDLAGAEYDASRAAKRLADARDELGAAMEIAQRAAVALVKRGISEVKAAETVGIDRMTLRKALGK